MPCTRRAHRRCSGLIALLVVAAVTAFGPAPTARAEPPGIPDEQTARSQLGALREAPAGSMDGYSREQFPHWSTVSGECDTREVVLARDGSQVRRDSDCDATSGSWYSPYDGATWSRSSDVDIDHVVALAEAWRSGADDWTEARCEAFANDLDNSQLIAVTDDVNQAKGDGPPDAWKPPLRSYWCTYSRMWIGSKSAWDLTVTSAERTALHDMLATC